MTHFQVVMFSLILVTLLMFGAFFSMAETSLMAVNRYRLRHKARMKKRYAMRILQLLRRPDRLLGAILIGNTFANMLASALGTLIAEHYWGETGALIAAFILAFVVLIISEVGPKTLAAIYPDQVARWVAVPVQFVLQLLYPAVWFANSIANGLLRMVGVSLSGKSHDVLSREELRSVVSETAGKLSRQYQNMLLGILDLNTLTVDDVMIPQHEIAGIDITQPWETIVEQVKQSRQDWLPFYRETVNQVVGVLYIRDVFRVLLSKRHTIDKTMLMQFLQEPYFVPEGTSLSVQLTYFQQGYETRVAFVVDEYGEIKGLLTLKDILEEIVGDFTTMGSGKRMQLQSDGSYLVDASLTIREFNRFSEWELPVTGPRTLNGLIVEFLEAMPRAGSGVLIAGYPIEIMQVRENRVKLARIYPKLAEPRILEN